MLIGMLPDFLKPGLMTVLVGTAVGTRSMSRGHYYSGRGNQFWELLWEAGLTEDRILIPEQDSRVLDYGVGLTDLSKTKVISSDPDLRASDYDVPDFLRKIEKHRPRTVAFNGKTAAKVCARAMHHPASDLGPAPFAIGPAKVYVLPSSSGSNNDPRRFAPKPTKAAWWQDFGRWLRDRVE